MEINGLQVLFQIVNFGVVFVALTVLLYKPIFKILDERRQKIEDGQNAADKSLKEKEEIEALKKKSKTQADKEAALLLEKAKDESKELKNRLTKEAKDEVKTMKEKELSKVQDEIKGMKSDLDKKVTDMAIAIAGKVLGSEVDKKTHSNLIDQSIKDLEKAI